MMVRRGMRRVGVGLAVVMGALCSSASLGASAEIEYAIERLDSDRFEERRLASESLLEAPGSIEGFLEGVLRSGKLSPEGERRVYEVLRERFMGRARAAIGISFQPQSTLIQHVHDGFPCGRAKLLRVGDEIIGVEGQPLDASTKGQDVLRHETLSREPGEVLELRVRRLDGEGMRELEIEARLGSEMDFPQMAQARAQAGRVAMSVFSEHAKSSAFDVRMARKGILVSGLRLGAEDDGLRWASEEVWGRRADGRGSVLSGDGASMAENLGSGYRMARAQDRQRQLANVRANEAQLAQVQRVIEARDRIRQQGGAGVIVQQGADAKAREDNLRAVQEKLKAARLEIARRENAERQRAIRAEMEGDGSTIRIRDMADPVGEANRIATRLTRLERELEEQIRLARSDDAGRQRAAAGRAEALRHEMAGLRVRLVEALGAAEALEGEVSAEASALDE